MSDPEVVALRNRVTELEALMTRHVGLDYGRVQNPNAPHPNQQVEAVELHGGVTQLRDSGIQLAAHEWDLRPPPGSYFTATVNDEEKKYGAVYFPYDFVDDITAVSRGVHGGSSTARTLGTVKAYMIAIDSGAKYAQVLASYDQTTAMVKFSVNGPTGWKYVQFLDSTAGGTGFLMNGLDGLVLPVGTADPTGSNVTLDGTILYRSDTDKFRGRANGAWIDLATGSGSLKTASTGYFIIPAGPAVGTTVTSGAANTYGSYTEMEDSTGAAIFVCGVAFRTSSTGAYTYLQGTIATGAAASESAVSEFKSGIQRAVAGEAAQGQWYMLPFPVPVATATRIAVKVADDVGTLGWDVSLLCINQSNLVAI